ncbi:MAG: elongator complex protein 3, partial [Methermicoccaceae archaeon]
MRMHQTDGSENENIVQEVRVQRACKWVAECLMKEFPESMKKRQQTLYDPTLITRLEKLKREASRRFSLHRLPKNTEILHLLNRRYIIKKPIKTLSGVAPIALMTSPAPCPHGVCLQCPGGPNSSFNSPQSYTGMEPAARRGARNKYDPYLQCTSRMKQLDSMGHPIGKVELIIMGGTFSSRAPPYQRWFVGEALRAMNEYPLSQMGHPAPSGELSPMELEARARENEVAKVRCVGMTIETRPDYVIRELNHMLSLGTTKIEIGVQSTSNEVLM